MLAERLRRKFHGKRMTDLEDFLIQFYPLGEFKYQVSGKLTFHTGVSVRRTLILLGKTQADEVEEQVIETGMHVDDNGDALMYDGEVKI